MLKKIEYRINYRSTREMDLIFRKFWSDFKNDHSEEELKIFKRLIDENDVDIYNWIISVSTIPDIYKILIEKIRTKIEFNVK
tara:strand:+ start:729 stop:974 length:246 start_codon:yes stop_codon:yes gene_type:complete